MNCKNTLQTLFFLIVSVCTQPLYAVSVQNFILDQNTAPSSLGSNMVYLEDESGSLNFKTIQEADAWLPSPDMGVTKGFTKSTYWLKFTVENTLETTFNWKLEFSYPLLDEIEFFQPDIRGVYQSKLMGDHQPFSDREVHYRNVVVPLTAQPFQVNTYYVRIKTTSSMNALLQVWPSNTFYQEVDSTKFILGILYGVVLLALFTSLVNSFYLKDLMYLWLCLSFLGISLYLSGVKGITFQYLWPNSNWWSETNIPFFVNLGYAPVLQYTRLFMSLKDIAPRLDKLFVLFIWVAIAGGLCSLFVSYGIMIRFCTLSASLMSILCITAGCYAWSKGNTSSRLYVFSWLIWFLGSVTFALTASGIFPRSFLTVWSQEVGFFFFVILMTIAQFDRFLHTLKSHEKEQQTALKALSNAEEEYRSLFENAIEGIFKLDSKGVLNNANKTFLDITNLQEFDQLNFENYEPFSLCFLGEQETTKFRNLLIEETSVSDYICSFENIDGEVKWLSLSIQKIKDNVDGSISYRGSLADITETKKREYAEKQRHMAEASTQAKDQFLSNMSEEIRSPVSSIIEYTNKVSEINLNKEIDTHLLKIKRYSANLLGTINDILDFSDMESGKLVINYESYNIRQVLDNISHVVGDSVDEKNLTLLIDIDDDIPETLIGDNARISQILTNLTNNAVKFTDQGEIEIALELVALNKKSGAITITGSVSDSGKGISSQQQAVIFESQTHSEKNTNRNTGFGLSITKQLLELMNGSISVSSIEGQGSVFTFQFTCRIESKQTKELSKQQVSQTDDEKQIEQISTPEVIIESGSNVPASQNHENTSRDGPVKEKQIENALPIETNSDQESAEQKTSLDEPSLDQQDGLERCQGNHKLYLKLFAEFIKNYSLAAEQMTNLLEQGDLISIAKLAHTLKGLSANLGAKKLSKLSVSLEKITALSLNEQEAAIKLYKSELSLVVDKMNETLNAAPEEHITQSPCLDKFDAAELQSVIDSLSGMINEQKMEAYDEALSIISRWPIPDHETLLNEIAEFLDLFDFENAAKSCDVLIKEIKAGNFDG